MTFGKYEVVLKVGDKVVTEIVPATTKQDAIWYASNLYPVSELQSVADISDEWVIYPDAVVRALQKEGMSREAITLICRTLERCEITE